MSTLGAAHRQMAMTRQKRRVAHQMGCAEEGFWRWPTLLLWPVLGHIVSTPATIPAKRRRLPDVPSWTGSSGKRTPTAPYPPLNVPVALTIYVKPTSLAWPFAAPECAASAQSASGTAVRHDGPKKKPRLGKPGRWGRGLGGAAVVSEHTPWGFTSQMPRLPDC